MIYLGWSTFKKIEARGSREAQFKKRGEGVIWNEEENWKSHEVNRNHDV